MSGSMKHGVYYHGRDLGLDYSTLDLSYEGCVQEALRVEDKYAPAEVVQVEVSIYMYSDPKMYYQGEEHSFDEALDDGVLG